MTICSDCRFVYADAMEKNSPFGSTDCWEEKHPEDNKCKSYRKKEKDQPVHE